MKKFNVITTTGSFIKQAETIGELYDDLLAHGLRYFNNKLLIPYYQILRIEEVKEKSNEG